LTGNYVGVASFCKRVRSSNIFRVKPERLRLITPGSLHFACKAMGSCVKTLFSHILICCVFVGAAEAIFYKHFLCKEFPIALQAKGAGPILIKRIGAKLCRQNTAARLCLQNEARPTESIVINTKLIKKP
jgi:hypothetical protein